MNFIKNNLLKTSLLAFASLLFIQCTDDDFNFTPVSFGDFFVGIEYGPEGTNYLVTTDKLSEGNVSPVGNGIELLGWSNYIQGIDQVFSLSGATITSYEKDVNKDLIQGSTVTTPLGTYAWEVVDESTMVAVGSPWFSEGTKQIYLIDTDAMSITKTIDTPLAESIVDATSGNTYLPFPTGAEVVGGHLFVSFYYGNADYTSLNTNSASVAVYSYPELEFEKIITDDRASAVGRYYSDFGMVSDEFDNIYTVSSSSFHCGYIPVPTTKSSILKIKKGASEFDENFHIDFETLSGGYKLNDMYYAGNGKAVVRFVKDDSDRTFTWGTYKPNGENPLLGFGIVDLDNETFTDLSTGNVELSGGGWNGVALVQDGNTVYVGVNNSGYSGVYVIDIEAKTISEGANIDGNYTNGIVGL